MSKLTKHQAQLLQNVYDHVHDAHFSIDSIDLKNHRPKELDDNDYEDLILILVKLQIIDLKLLNLLERNKI